MHIMLIDDDEACLVGLASAIEPAELDIEIFTVPEKAVGAYAGGGYDLVITDMKMPGMNGIQVLKAIRGLDPEAKVIIITGYGDVETAIDAVNNKAYAFFGKPIDIEELLETIEKIRNAVEEKQKTKEEYSQLVAEYKNLKKAYHELQNLIKEKTAQGK